MTLGPLLQVAGQSHPLASILGKKANSFYAPNQTNYLALALLIQESSKPVAVITSTARQAEEIADALRELVADIQVIDFPAWETLPHERLSPSPETVGKRLQSLHLIHCSQSLR